MTTTVQDLKNQANGTKIPAGLKPKDQVKALLEQNRGLIKQALPKHINPDRLLRVAQTSVTTTPGLLECFTGSLIGGIMQCAQMGLEPNTVLGHAYLIPFWNSKKQRKEAQVVIGYKGLIDLARRSGQIISIAAHAVCENDEFSFQYGLSEELTHKPNMGDRGPIIGFYAVAHMKDGGHAFEVMSRQQVEAIRDKYGNKNKVWFDDFEQMGRKTLIRRLSKYLPLSVEFATASAMDESAERGESQGLESSLDGEYSIMPEDSPTNEDVPITDRFGEVFDPDKHASKNGQPVFNADDTLRKKRQPKRKAGEPLPDNLPKDDPSLTQSQPKQEPPKDQAYQTSDDTNDTVMPATKSITITQSDVLKRISTATTKKDLDIAGDLIPLLDIADQDLPCQEYDMRCDEFKSFE